MAASRVRRRTALATGRASARLTGPNPATDVIARHFAQREHCIAALSVAPGFMQTERVVEAFRGIERVIERSGQVEVGALAAEYGFTGVNGTQPPPFRVRVST
jgi:hypothetical protein